MSPQHTDPSAAPQMTFLEHLEELRTRIVYSALAVLVGIGVCWFFRESIRAFLEAPLYDVWSSVPGLPPPEPLRFTSLIEPFIIYLKLAGIGGLFLASPVVFYQLWKFIAPGLYPRERRYVFPFVISSSLLFVLGALGAYKFVFPAGFAFFLEFSAGGQHTVFTADVTVPTAQAPQAEPAPLPPPQRATDTGTDTEMDTDTGVSTDTGARTDTGVSTDTGARTDTDASTDTGVAADTAVAVHADTNADTDANTDTGVAAVPEASVSAVPETSTSPAVSQTPSPSLAARLRDVVAGWFDTPVCGELTATLEDDGRVDLSFRQQDPACGEMRVVAIQRDDTALTLSLTQDGDTTSARDAPGPGAFQYAVTVLQTPQSQGKLSPMLMVSDYLNFAIKLLLAFGLIFELPVLIVFLALAGLVNWRQLVSFSRWFALLAFIVGAMLTPPDVFTQTMLAVPLIVLYLLSILVVFFINKKQELEG